MDWLATILTSSNAYGLVILVIIIVVIIAILAKLNIISFRNDKLRIGIQDSERTIIRQQIEFAENACMSFVWEQSLPDGIDKYRIRYVNEKLYDEMVKWISFNHISTDDTYVEIKQNIIWSIITALTENQYFRSDEFRSMVDAEVKRIIIKLCEIRKYYSKK